MIIWIFLGLMLWVLAWAFDRSARRFRNGDVQLEIPLRRGLRVVFLLLIVAAVSIGALVAAAGLVPPVGRLLGTIPHPTAAVGQALAVWAVAWMGRLLVTYGGLTLTTTGIRLVHVFIPWSEVRDLKIAGSTLVIATPRLRASWNGWTGKLVIPLWWWHPTREDKDRLVDLYRSADDVT